MIERETSRTRILAGHTTDTLAPAIRAGHRLSRFVRTKPLGAIGGGITLLLIVFAILAPTIPPMAPRRPWEERMST